MTVLHIARQTFCAVFAACFWRRSNKQGTVAAPFTKSEQVRVLLVRHINDIVYSNNLRKEDGLKIAFKGQRLQITSRISTCNKQCVCYIWQVCAKSNKAIYRTFCKYSEQKRNINLNIANK
jgi:hypothetical protein